MHGYMGKIVRINLSKNKIRIENTDKLIAYNYLGGRGYSAKILLDELKPKIDPLSEENKILFMTGPLTATGFPGSGRISISSKSPLTNTIFDSSMGSSFGVYLKRSGYDGLIIEGREKKPVYIVLDDGEVSIEDASDVWGKSTYEVQDYLSRIHRNSKVAVIGRAGENLARIACIISETRAAGRGGLGAVMGYKRVKAIVAGGRAKVGIAHRKAFKSIVRKVRRVIESHPITGKDGSLSLFGTALLVHRITAAKMLPRDNFSGEDLDFDDVDKFSGETIREKYLVGQRGCFACPTKCGRIVKFKGRTVKGAEFESIAMLGPNAGFYEYEEIEELALMCDELGIDTISAGNILGFARKSGILKNFEDAKRILIEIAEGWSIFSRGVAEASIILGMEDEAVHVKGLELPAYDPRGAKGIALAYATSNRGGCHLRAYTIAPEILSNPEFVNPQTEINKAKLVKRMQDVYAVYDSAIICKFHGFALFYSLEFELDYIAKALTALTGWNWSEEHLYDVGAKIYDTERLFNVREGFDSRHDTLPKKFGIDLSSLLHNYYRERSWEDGIPKEIHLVEPFPVKEIKIVESPFELIDVPQLQVALDMDADLDSICEIARMVYDGGARIVEAGTPAIKRHGVDRLIPALRKVAQDAVIVTDLKTMDVGNLEARIAFRAGADIVAVLAVGGTRKIREALSEAIRRDKAILIDLIGCDDPLEMMKRLVDEFKGFEDRLAFCLHKGISDQLRGRGIYEHGQLIREARKIAKNFLLFVAGGIKEGVARDVIDAGADVCIVGSAIYNSSNPEEATRRILKEIRA